MSLDEEIETYRFGQGAYPIEELLARFAPLDKSEKRLQLLALHRLIQHVKPADVDTNQVIADSGLDPADPACVLIKIHRFIPDVSHIQEGDHNQVYRLLLYVFKQAYQRQLALNKGVSTDWQYTDLSSDETALALLAKRKALVEAIYSDASFRNEFASLAKLWHRSRAWEYGKRQKPAPEDHTKFDFLSYDDLITEQVSIQTDKNMHAASLLHRSLHKGLVVRYQLAVGEAQRLLLDVLDRHSTETYGTGFF